MLVHVEGKAVSKAGSIEGFFNARPTAAATETSGVVAEKTVAHRFFLEAGLKQKVLL
jgi:hypothetical protein